MGKRLLVGIVLYLLTCRRCGSPFAICESCYRGQWYCGWRCRLVARILSRRVANRRDQTSRHGRFNHADRQREYRLHVLAGEGHVKSPGEQDPRANFRTVSPGFFAALGVPMLAGRDFTARPWS